METQQDLKTGDEAASPFAFPVYGDLALPMQRNLTALRRASECLLQGWMEIAAKRAEFAQRVTLEMMAEWQELSRVRGPDEWLQSEFALTRNQTERSITALRSFNDDVMTCCFHAVEAAVGEINGAMPKLADGKTGKKSKAA